VRARCHFPSSSSAHIFTTPPPPRCLQATISTLQSTEVPLPSAVPTLFFPVRQSSHLASCLYMPSHRSLDSFNFFNSLTFHLFFFFLSLSLPPLKSPLKLYLAPFTASFTLFHGIYFRYHNLHTPPLFFHTGGVFSDEAARRRGQP
jgi:hypothetical protein